MEGQIARVSGSVGVQVWGVGQEVGVRVRRLGSGLGLGNYS